VRVYGQESPLALDQSTGGRGGCDGRNASPLTSAPDLRLVRVCPSSRVPVHSFGWVGAALAGKRNDGVVTWKG
jgi:hypothetical protein